MTTTTSTYEREDWWTILPDGRRYGRYDSRDEALKREVEDREFMESQYAEFRAAGWTGVDLTPPPAIAIEHVHQRVETTTFETVERVPIEQRGAK
jgi:hypothetical protein